MTPRCARAHYRGCLLGGAIGDALGAPIEFMSLAEIREASRYADGRWSALMVRNGLSNDVVMSIMEDMEGSLWVGTNGSGLDRFDAALGAIEPAIRRDLAGEALHFYDPDRHWLWTRWMWDPELRTGALPLVTMQEFDLGGPTAGQIAVEGVGDGGHVPCFEQRGGGRGERGPPRDERRRGERGRPLRPPAVRQHGEGR